LKRFKTQQGIADAAGSTRQAVSIAFKRGRLSFEMAAILAKRMRIPVSSLLTQWHPDTHRKAKASPWVKRRLRAVEQRQE
jgi:hypothetical protein